MQEHTIKWKLIYPKHHQPLIIAFSSAIKIMFIINYIFGSNSVMPYTMLHLLIFLFELS